MRFLFCFLELEKRALGFAAATGLLFSQYTPDLSNCLVEGGVQNTRNRTLAALYLLLSWEEFGCC